MVRKKPPESIIAKPELQRKEFSGFNGEEVFIPAGEYWVVAGLDNARVYVSEGAGLEITGNIEQSEIVTPSATQLHGKYKTATAKVISGERARKKLEKYNSEKLGEKGIGSGSAVKVADTNLANHPGTDKMAPVVDQEGEKPDDLPPLPRDEEISAIQGKDALVDFFAGVLGKAPAGEPGNNYVKAVMNKLKESGFDPSVVRKGFAGAIKIINERKPSAPGRDGLAGKAQEIGDIVSSPWASSAPEEGDLNQTELNRAKFDFSTLASTHFRFDQKTNQIEELDPEELRAILDKEEKRLRVVGISEEEIAVIKETAGVLFSRLNRDEREKKASEYFMTVAGRMPKIALQTSGNGGNEIGGAPQALSATVKESLAVELEKEKMNWEKIRPLFERMVSIFNEIADSAEDDNDREIILLKNEGAELVQNILPLLPQNIKAGALRLKEADARESGDPNGETTADLFRAKNEFEDELKIYLRDKEFTDKKDIYLAISFFVASSYIEITADEKAGAASATDKVGRSEDESHLSEIKMKQSPAEPGRESGSSGASEAVGKLSAPGEDGLAGKAQEKGEDLNGAENPREAGDMAVETEGRFKKIESQEEKERRETRERVLIAIHNFLKDRNKDTSLYGELAKTIESVKKSLTEALPYFEAAAREIGYVNKYRDIRVDTGGYQITLKGINIENNTEETFIYGEHIPGFLERGFSSRFESEQKFQRTKKEIQKCIPRLRELKSAVGAHREKIFRELVLALDKGDLLQEGELNQPMFGLYGIDGYVWFKFRKNQEIEGKFWEGIYYNGDRDNEGPLDIFIAEAMREYGITEAEIAELNRIEWSDTDREKLGRLQRAVSRYREGLPQAIPQGDSPRVEHDLLLSIHTARYARDTYLRLNLPPQHRERVVEQIRTGGIEL